ncbi:hypothetical protein AB0N93_06250 [Streptomyces sp. NPDC091267]
MLDHPFKQRVVMVTPTKPLRDGLDVVEDIFEVFDASLEVRQFR